MFALERRSIAITDSFNELLGLYYLSLCYYWVVHSIFVGRIVISLASEVDLTSSLSHWALEVITRFAIRAFLDQSAGSWNGAGSSDVNLAC